jgi:hypothetical protein
MLLETSLDDSGFLEVVDLFLDESGLEADFLNVDRLDMILSFCFRIFFVIESTQFVLVDLSIFLVD